MLATIDASLSSKLKKNHWFIYLHREKASSKVDAILAPMKLIVGSIDTVVKNEMVQKYDPWLWGVIKDLVPRS